MASEKWTFARENNRYVVVYGRLLCVVLCLTITVIFNTCSVASFSICDKNVSSPKICSEGECVNNTCVCFPGWAGELCDECNGRFSMNLKEGIIYDGRALTYSKDTMCSWLLDTGKDSGNVSVRFVFKEFETECGWDHLYIHDGDSVFSPLIAAYSGLLVSKDDNTTVYEFTITFSGRYGYLHFYSDAAYTMSGFSIFYSVGGCYLNCSGHGACNDSKCVCNTGWTGQGCEVDLNFCLNNCSGVGTCSNGLCTCDSGYRGSDCGTKDGETLWERLTVDNAPSSRASHAALMHQNIMWILGGFTLSYQEHNTVALFNTTENKWSSMNLNGNSLRSPWPLYGHSAVVYQDKIYLYGGVRQGLVVDELWVFNMHSLTWQQLNSSGYPSSGHAAYVFGGAMYIFFGYSPTYGYLNAVRLFNFSSNEWSRVETIGSNVKGTYGCASAFDEANHRVYFFGGYHSNSEASPTSSYNLTDSLYVFDLISKQWLVLLSSGSPRYLHSMVILGRYLLVFGGNTHNDTSKSRGAKCFSTDFILYDITCNSWHVMSAPHIEGAARYGHSMVVEAHSGSLYVFGGFDSVMLNDVIRIQLGNCTKLTNETECSEAVVGERCIWHQGICLDHNDSVAAIDVCQNTGSERSFCSGYNTCSGCEGGINCTWSPHTERCAALNYSQPDMEQKSNGTGCNATKDAGCELYHTCQACTDDLRCEYVATSSAKPCRFRIVDSQGSGNVTNHNQTERQQVCLQQPPCASSNSCGSCTVRGCMWCSNLGLCVDTNAYVASFPYGQCMDWTTKQDKCNATECFSQKSCSSCLSISKCGWCNDPSNNGLGECMEGSMNSSRLPNDTTDNYTQCSADRWFFTQCPVCQCNGHSTCVGNSSTCQSCKPPTTGSQCEQCLPFFYGNPVNGGNCSECQCNGQADSCNPTDGQCFCNTRGVTGKNCDKCDDTHKYTGDPKNGGTCYYGLSTDYQYTFNFSKAEDINYTQVNFLSTPSSTDRDVDFTLNCSGFALLNITFKTKNQLEQVIIGTHECDYFRTKFEHKDYAFGGDTNGTFYVYVYGFKTPFWLQISFSQFPKIDLVHFFITFFSCFLSLLLIAAALWKIKHKYDNYRRRQQMMVEMQQMASRPFSSVCVEVEKKSEHATGGAPERKELRDHVDSALRRRKKLANKPSALAIEPLTGNKAAVLTLLVQLPFGDGDFAPAGQSALALGSALVAFSSNRKQSLEHIKGDKPRIRKNLCTHSDAPA